MVHDYIKEFYLILELHLPSNVAVEEAVVAIIVELVDGEFVVSGVPEVLPVTNKYGFLLWAEYQLVIKITSRFYLL